MFKPHFTIANGKIPIMIEGIKRELKTFGENTSIRGISRTMKSHSRVVKIFWVMTLLISFSLLLFQVVSLVITYRKHGITNSFMWVPSQPNFPDVTICNLFPIADEKQFLELYDIFLQKIEIVKSQAPNELKNIKRLWNYAKCLDAFNTNIPFLQEFNSKARLNSMIVDSYFYEWDLFKRRESQQVSTLYVPLQLCTTLTPNSSDAAISAIIFTNDLMPKLIDSYYNNLRVSMASGVKVMIHPKGKKPARNKAIYVQPGTSITIDIKQSNITRLPHPYGNCNGTQQVANDDKKMPPYDQEMCLSLCSQRQVIRKCGCLCNYEYFTDADLQMGNYTFCTNITKHLENPEMYTEQGVFTQRFWTLINCYYQFTLNQDSCDCPVPCSETQYDISSSSAYWPNIHYHLAFYEFYIRDDDRYREKFEAYERILNNSYSQCDAETLEELRKLQLIEKNFLEVTVKMSQRLVQLADDVPQLALSTVVSNLGGSLSLFLGVSIMTAAEIIELIYSLVKIALARKKD